MVAPAVARNLAVSGEPVLVSGGGLALYMGNRAGADGRVASDLPGGGEFRHCFDYRAVVRRLSREAGRPLSPGEVDRHYRSLAVRLAVADLLTDVVPLPLFFDDSFVHYDEGRLGNLRKTLDVLAKERQWILLTHREDLGAWAEPVRREEAEGGR